MCYCKVKSRSMKYWVLWVLWLVGLIVYSSFNSCGTVHKIITCTIHKLLKNIDFPPNPKSILFSFLLQPYSFLNPNFSSAILHTKSSNFPNLKPTMTRCIQIPQFVLHHPSNIISSLWKHETNLISHKLNDPLW